jgi:RNAse (barnase) inhibitor barstar
MTKQELIINLECWIDILKNPLYNPLEVGFRHRSLTDKEKLERYSQECSWIHHAMTRVKEELERGEQNE